MRLILRILKGFEIFLGSIIFLVFFDIMVLGGQIKLLIKAVANTTSYSPFSTDGQSNWIFILMGIGVLFLGYIIIHSLHNKSEET